MDYILNPALEIGPGEGDGYVVRLPLLGRSTPATGYQVNLLRSFTAASTLEQVSTAFPFEKEATREFLARCVAQAVLVPVDAAGEPVLPLRAAAQPSLLQTPPFDPARPAAFTFLGVPYDGATTGVPGARFGPGAIRQAGAGARYRLDRLKLEPEGFHDYASGRRLLEGIRLADAGDVSFNPGEETDALMARITEAVRELLAAETVPIVLGGDHSITFGVLRAFAGQQLSVVHVDAHTDLGSYPGNPLHHGTVFVHVLERLPDVERLYQVGLRGLVEGLSHEDFGDRVFQLGIDRLRRDGLDPLLARLPEGGAYYVSLDIDAVDPAFAPATGTPVPNGLHPHELKALVRAIASRRRVVGLDVVEVGQPTGPSDGTPQLALEAILAFADGAVEYVRNAIAREGHDG